VCVLLLLYFEKTAEKFAWAVMQLFLELRTQEYDPNWKKTQ